MASVPAEDPVVLVVADSSDRFSICLDALGGAPARVQCETDPSHAPERVRELRPKLVIIAVKRARDLRQELVDAVRSVGARIRAVVEDPEADAHT